MNCDTACGLCYLGIGEQGGALLLLQRYACSTRMLSFAMEVGWQGTGAEPSCEVAVTPYT